MSRDSPQEAAEVLEASQALLEVLYGGHVPQGEPENLIEERNPARREEASLRFRILIRDPDRFFSHPTGRGC